MPGPIAYVKFGMTNLNTGGTQLLNITSLNFSNGRTWATDVYNPGEATINCRSIDTWTTAPKIGDMVRIAITYSTNIESWIVWCGHIKDVQINYGSVASLDTAVITCEGPLAFLGRTELTSTALTQVSTLAQVTQVATAAGATNFINVATANGKSTAAAQTYTGNALAIANELNQTEVGHIREYQSSTKPVAEFEPRNFDVTRSYTFSDNPASSSEMKYDYDGIDFTSAAQDYYTKVTIQPQTVATQSAGSGLYGLTQSSVDYNTSQALSHAQYLLSQYNSQTSRPYRLRLTFSNQGNDTTRQDRFRVFMSSAASGSGQAINVVFRGTTYVCVIEGRQITMDPAETVIEITMSSYDTNNYLKLNDSVFGRLNYNKLGF